MRWGEVKPGWSLGGRALCCVRVVAGFQPTRVGWAAGLPLGVSVLWARIVPSHRTKRRPRLPGPQPVPPSRAPGPPPPRSTHAPARPHPWSCCSLPRPVPLPLPATPPTPPPQLVVLGPGGSEQRWESGPNRTISLQPPPPEDWVQTPGAAAPDTVNGHFVLLCHWGLTGCAQALYRPHLGDAEGEREAGWAACRTSRHF